MANKLYRIATEDTNREAVEQLVTKHFPAFTSFSAEGHWNGEKEHSLIIEVASNEEILPQVRSLAGEIKTMNKQEAVLVEWYPISQELI